MTKIAGSGSESGSFSQRHGSEDPDPDPPQNDMDPQHWFFVTRSGCRDMALQRSAISGQKGRGVGAKILMFAQTFSHFKPNVTNRAGRYGNSSPICIKTGLSCWSSTVLSNRMRNEQYLWRKRNEQHLQRRKTTSGSRAEEKPVTMDEGTLKTPIP